MTLMDEPMSQMGLREYIDELQAQGYRVEGGKGEDPLLIRPDGRAVETWREDYPYDEMYDRDTYEEEKYLLQMLGTHRGVEPGRVALLVERQQMAADPATALPSPVTAQR